MLRVHGVDMFRGGRRSAMPRPALATPTPTTVAEPPPRSSPTTSGGGGLSRRLHAKVVAPRAVGSAHQENGPFGLVVTALGGVDVGGHGAVVNRTGRHQAQGHAAACGELLTSEP